MVFGIDDMALAAVSSAAIGGAAGLLGQSNDNEFNEQMYYTQRNDNRYDAQVARDWSERLSNTAYQRSRADMEKAGLNPMLMAQQGGASSPGAAQASSAQAPQHRSPLNAIAPALSSAVDVLHTLTAVDKTRADTKVSDTQAGVNAAMANKVLQDTKTGSSSAKNLDAQTDNLRQQNKVWQKDAWKADKVNKAFGFVDSMIDRVKGIVRKPGIKSTIGGSRAVSD